MDQFESPRPDGVGRCSDNDCPCPNTELPPGTGYMYVSQAAVEYRRDARSVAEAYAKMERERTGNTFVIHEQAAIDGILMCEQGARLREVDLAIARSDAQHWWSTGWIPLRATPKAGSAPVTEALPAQEKEIERIVDLVQACCRDKRNILWQTHHFLPIAQASSSVVHSLQLIKERGLLGSDEERGVLESLLTMAVGLKRGRDEEERKEEEAFQHASAPMQALGIKPRDGLQVVGSLEQCAFCGMGARGSCAFEMYFGYKKYTTVTYQGGSTKKLSAHLTGRETIICCVNCLAARVSQKKKAATWQLTAAGAAILGSAFFLIDSLDRGALSIPLVPLGIAAIVLLVLGLSNLDPRKNGMLLAEFRKRKDAEKYRKAIDNDIRGVRSGGRYDPFRVDIEALIKPQFDEQVAHTQHFWTEPEYQDIFHGKGLDRELNP